MKKINDHRRKNHYLATLLAFAMIAFYGCATADPQSISTFKQGLSAVQTESQTIFLEYNQFVREMQLDRVEKLTSLKESDLAPGLDASSLTRWNATLEAMSLYASSLETLASPAGGAQVEQSLQALGNRIIALSPPADPGESKKDELNLAVSHIGKRIVESKARRKAMELAQDVDPSVRSTCLHMADMIGSSHTTSGLRATMWSNWTTRADGIRIQFLDPGVDKRKIAMMYAAVLDDRLSSDAALAALRQALLNLADLHTAVSQGRSADATAIIALLRQEVAFARQLLESAKVIDTQGGTP